MMTQQRSMGAAPLDDEARFRKWYETMAFVHHLDPDPDSPEQSYDYRAAFRAGARPDRNGHWPEKFKRAAQPAPELSIAEHAARYGQTLRGRR